MEVQTLENTIIQAYIHQKILKTQNPEYPLSSIHNNYFKDICSWK